MSEEEGSAATPAEAPAVSVVIPCYNQGRYLRDAVESVLCQTYPHVEAIVVNDGSTDETAVVAAAFGDRIRVVTQENAGLAAARNAGIRASSAPYVMVLDADDTIDPDCVEQRVRFFLEDPSVGIVAGGFRLVDEHLNPYPDDQQRWRTPKVGSPSLYIREAWSPTCGLLLSRRALEVCGMFDPFLRACEDWDMQMRVTRRFRHVYEPAMRANYRQLPGSMSRDHLVMVDSLLQVLRKNRAYASNDFRYRIDAFAGWFNQVAGSVFGNILKETRGVGKARAFGRLLVKRPCVAPLFVVWAVRYVWNRVLWVFGTGPLRVREVRHG
ncbi:MAG: glycosyltransferase family 2 protein [Fimbriimonadaceae bacterium]|nr:glycosyltransferase family 2 protein [Chthonomonadaceae bacterium]MCO5297686.1 glycosyltransferase family 2 protein [Fimbriimonadaceae bacterium]